MTPKIENIQPNSRYCQNVLNRACSPVCTLKIGSVGSDLRISCRTAVVIAAGAPPATRIVRPVLRVAAYGYDTKAYGDGFPSRMLNRRKSPTTPMTVIH